MATVSDLLLKRHADWGVDRIYRYPGDGMNGIIGALDRSSVGMSFASSVLARLPEQTVKHAIENDLPKRS